MHELSIVEAVIEQVQREVRRSGHKGRVTRLELVVGRLAGVNVEAIRFAFEILAPGTLLEAADVRIARPGAVCSCRACGRATEIDDLVAQCPACGSADVTFEGGRDLLLQSIDLDESACPAGGSAAE